MTDPPDGPIVGIVLAAGMSRRLGRPKQLLDLAGKPLVAHVVEHCLASHLDRVIVVVGHDAGAVQHALAGYAVTFAVNSRFAEGQSTSLRAGLDTARHADAVIVVLGDQPGIASSTIDGLVEARRAGRSVLGMAAYGAERGHPVLFGRELFGELDAITGDQGGREVIRRHRSEIVFVPGGSPDVPLDVDTEEAYARLLERGIDS